MKKPSTELWSKAKALHASGKSLREIEMETEIPFKTIARKAKTDDWPKGTLTQLIKDAIKVQSELTQLPVSEQAVVSKAVSDEVKRLDFLNKAALKNVAVAMKLPCNAQIDCKHRADTILKGKETVFGKQPDTAIQINNQQPSTSLPVEELSREQLMAIATGK